jgi:hypothetical protein
MGAGWWRESGGGSSVCFVLGDAGTGTGGGGGTVTEALAAGAGAPTEMLFCTSFTPEIPAASRAAIVFCASF